MFIFVHSLWPITGGLTCSSYLLKMSHILFAAPENDINVWEARGLTTLFRYLLVCKAWVDIGFRCKTWVARRRSKFQKHTSSNPFNLIQSKIVVKLLASFTNLILFSFKNSDLLLKSSLWCIKPVFTVSLLFL